MNVRSLVSKTHIVGFWPSMNSGCHGSSRDLKPRSIDFVFNPMVKNRRQQLSLGKVARAAAPRRELSFQQRWRALKFAVQERKAQLANSQPLSSIIHVAMMVRARLQPLVDVFAALRSRWEQLGEDYNQFLAYETKEKWAWSKRNRKELDLLDSVPPYLFALACTLLYQAFMPVSLLFCVVAPLYYAWIMWDRWWLSPVFLGSLAMAPLKFPPWGWVYFCWIWPGLM